MGLHVKRPGFGCSLGRDRLNTGASPTEEHQNGANCQGSPGLGMSWSEYRGSQAVPTARRSCPQPWRVPTLSAAILNPSATVQCRRRSRARKSLAIEGTHISRRTLPLPPHTSPLQLSQIHLLSDAWPIAETGPCDTPATRTPSPPGNPCPTEARQTPHFSATLTNHHTMASPPKPWERPGATPATSGAHSRFLLCP